MPAVRLWLSVQTQWRTGFAGATGLDYNALFQVARAIKIRIDADTLRKIRDLESMMLTIWADESKKRKKKGRISEQEP